MDLGTIIAAAHPNDYVEQANRAEDFGFTFVGLVDSQGLAPELYTTLGLVARETDTVEIGPSVTNPVTRHPVVTASAIQTADVVSEGRAVLGIGGGDTAVFTLGKNPGSLNEIETCIRIVQALTQGQEYEFESHDVNLQWVSEKEKGVEVLLAASGPKTLELGGRVADRVLIGGGITPEFIEEAVEMIRRGARKEGRNPEEITIWAWPSGLVTDDWESDRKMILSSVAHTAHLTFQFTLEAKQVPSEYQDPIRELVQRYDSHEALDYDQGSNRKLVEELGLEEFLLDRFTVAGTPSECANKLDHIAGLPGVDGIHFLPIGDSDRLIERMGTDVLPLTERFETPS